MDRSFAGKGCYKSEICGLSYKVSHIKPSQITETGSHSACLHGTRAAQEDRGSRAGKLVFGQEKHM